MGRKRTKQERAEPENIILHDSEGHVRIVLGVFDGRATLQMNDAREQPCVIMQVQPDGQAGLSLQTSGKGGQVNLSADPDGAIGLSIMRPGKTPVLSLSWDDKHGLRLSLWDRSGKPVWQGFEPIPAMNTKGQQAEDENQESP